MANEVYANGMELACKAGQGKSICAFPDVCFTPPENPATPPGIPIPYPNTGMASDTTDGSKTVQISGKEVMLKNKSYFKKSTGDEAGCAAKKGVITSTNTGKVYFNAWSMDVKFEGENVVRNLDLTTHNHASIPGNTPTWPYLDGMSMSDPGHPCVDDQMKEMSACQDFEPYGDKGSPCPPDEKPATYEAAADYADNIAANECLAARRCQLVPYEPSGKQPSCCPGQTGHHLVEASSFYDRSRSDSNRIAIKGTEKYEPAKAPCICAEGTNNNHGTHGIIHTYQSTAAPNPGNGKLTLSNGQMLDVGGKDDCLTNYGNSRDQAAEAVTKAFPESACNEECIKKQLDAYHKKECNISDSTEIRGIKCGTRGPKSVSGAQQSVDFRSDQIERLTKGMNPLPRPPSPPLLR